MDERRRTPRASCRLHGRIRRPRGHVRVRVVDLSEGGLCLFSPIKLEPKTTIEIEIDVPGFPDCVVEADVWHVHRQKLRNSSRKIWAIGAMLDTSDDAYSRLLSAAGVAPEGSSEASIDRTRFEADSRTPSSPGRNFAPATTDESPTEDRGEPRIFRIRVQANTGPRTRLLTFTADSREHAEAIAAEDLEPEWRIIEVHVA